MLSAPAQRRSFTFDDLVNKGVRDTVREILGPAESLQVLLELEKKYDECIGDDPTIYSREKVEILNAKIMTHLEIVRSRKFFFQKDKRLFVEAALDTYVGVLSVFL